MVESIYKFFLKFRPYIRYFVKQGSVLFQQLFRVAVVVFHGVWIFDVEVVVARDNVFGFDFPGEFVFYPVVPSGFFRDELFYAHGVGFGIGLVAGRVRVFIVPYFFCGFAFREKEKVGLYAGVGG
jgi:hypothetical protein